MSIEQKIKLLTASELANILSISDRTLWRWRSAGRVPRPIRVGGSVRWKLADIEQWLEAGCPSQSTVK